MNDVLRNMARGFSYIGRAMSPRFEPLSTSPFADAKRSLVTQSEPPVKALMQRIDRHANPKAAQLDRDTQSGRDCGKGIQPDGLPPPAEETGRITNIFRRGF